MNVLVNNIVIKRVQEIEYMIDMHHLFVPQSNNIGRDLLTEEQIAGLEIELDGLVQWLNENGLDRNGNDIYADEYDAQMAAACH